MCQNLRGRELAKEARGLRTVENRRRGRATQRDSEKA
jgi:hypothetical protein